MRRDPELESDGFQSWEEVKFRSSRLGLVGEVIASLPDAELATLEVALGRCVGDVAHAPRARRLVAALAGEARDEARAREEAGGMPWR